MTIGPVEYMVVGFPGSEFNGEIAPELERLVRAGTIRVIDLLFVRRNDDGSVDWFEFEDHPELSPFGDVVETVDGLLAEEDAEMVAELLEPGSSAALLLFENVWARPLAEAARDSGAVILAAEYVPHTVVEEVRAALGLDA